jgi:hypothetical protein
VQLSVAKGLLGDARGRRNAADSVGWEYRLGSVVEDWGNLGPTRGAMRPLDDRHPQSDSCLFGRGEEVDRLMPDLILSDEHVSEHLIGSYPFVSGIIAG